MLNVFVLFKHVRSTLSSGSSLFAKTNNIQELPVYNWFERTVSLCTQHIGNNENNQIAYICLLDHKRLKFALKSAKCFQIEIKFPF